MLLAIKRRSLAISAALAMMLLGVALEFGQKLVPGRGFEIRDIFIDGAGVLTGFAIGILSRRIVPVVS
jgi:VanZ family protein